MGKLNVVNVLCAMQLLNSGSITDGAPSSNCGTRGPKE